MENYFRAYNMAPNTFLVQNVFKKIVFVWSLKLDIRKKLNVI